MAQQPNRPFESLDWYRDAARRGFAEETRDRDIVRLLTGGGLLRAHISVFAVTIVALMVLNLLRTPESIWVDRVLMGWTIILLIHGLVVGGFWAFHLWNADDPDEPVLIGNGQWQQAPMFGWGAPNTPSPEAREAQFRVAEPPPQAGPQPWADWTNAAPAAETLESERASWSEATVASWLERRSQQTAQSGNDADKDQPGT